MQCAYYFKLTIMQSDRQCAMACGAKPWNIKRNYKSIAFFKKNKFLLDQYKVKADIH